MEARHRYELPVEGQPDAAAAGLWQAGAVGVWERGDHLVAWFEDPSAPVPPGGSWSVEEDRDWQAEWKASVGPVRADRVVVVPTWHTDDPDPDPEDAIIVLDPGRAFGSGHHATTLQCLELLQAAEPRGRSVLDVGTGSGILAIAAARLGAVSVLGVDVDEGAVEVAHENARRNGVTLTLRHGSLDIVDTEHDIVLANLTTGTLVALRDELRRVTTGTLVASGIADERAPRAVAALVDAGFALVEQRSRDGWTALLMAST